MLVQLQKLLHMTKGNYLFESVNWKYVVTDAKHNKWLHSFKNNSRKLKHCGKIKGHSTCFLYALWKCGLQSEVILWTMVSLLYTQLLWKTAESGTELLIEKCSITNNKKYLEDALYENKLPCINPHPHPRPLDPCLSSFCISVSIFLSVSWHTDVQRCTKMYCGYVQIFFCSCVALRHGQNEVLVGL